MCKRIKKWMQAKRDRAEGRRLLKADQDHQAKYPGEHGHLGRVVDDMIEEAKNNKLRIVK